MADAPVPTFLDRFPEYRGKLGSPPAFLTWSDGTHLLVLAACEHFESEWSNAPSDGTWAAWLWRARTVHGKAHGCECLTPREEQAS